MPSPGKMCRRADANPANRPGCPRARQLRPRETSSPACPCLPVAFSSPASWCPPMSSGRLLPRRALRRGGAHVGAVDRRSGQQLGRLRLLRRPRPVRSRRHQQPDRVVQHRGPRPAQASGPSPAAARRAGRHRCQPRQIPQHLPQPKQSRAGLAAPRNRLMSRGSAGAHQGASPVRAASRPAKSSPQGPQARRCAAMPG